jgi:hypothetical protein
MFLKIKTAKLGSNSYVPAGLTASQYQKIRDADDAKKAANYDKNVKKAGKFLDFTKFYIQRGTDLNQAWAKQPGRGHTFAKVRGINLLLNFLLRRTHLLLTDTLHDLLTPSYAQTKYSFDTTKDGKKYDGA